VLDALIVVNHYFPVVELIELAALYMSFAVVVIGCKLIWKHIPVIGA
jgi:hypothetical protein